MLLYKFGARGSRVALTQDKTGSNLPEDGRPWKLLGLTRVDASDGPRIGADSTDIIAAIEKDGFFIFPTSK
jgi:uncharacterized membrane protein